MWKTKRGKEEQHTGDSRWPWAGRAVPKLTGRSLRFPVSRSETWTEIASWRGCNVGAPTRNREQKKKTARIEMLKSLGITLAEQSVRLQGCTRTDLGLWSRSLDFRRLEFQTWA